MLGAGSVSGAYGGPCPGSLGLLLNNLAGIERRRGGKLNKGLTVVSRTLSKGGIKCRLIYSEDGTEVTIKDRVEGGRRPAVTVF